MLTTESIHVKIALLLGTNAHDSYFKNKWNQFDATSSLLFVCFPLQGYICWDILAENLRLHFI